MVAVSVALFTSLEGWDAADAAYFAVITGTTIGYGDHPAFQTNAGKLAAAAFALLSINVVGFVTSAVGGSLSALINSATEKSKTE